MENTLHLWGRLSSLNVRKVVWTAQELGLDFQRTDAGAGFGVTTTPEYQLKNPNALVLRDGVQQLFGPRDEVMARFGSAPQAARA